MKNVTMNVTDMKCDGCATAVKSGLSRVRGVHRADVSLEQKQARVVLEDEATAENLVTAVREAGYSASLAG